MADLVSLGNEINQAPAPADTAMPEGWSLGTTGASFVAKRPAEPAPTKPASDPSPVAKVRGDDLMAQARSFNEVSPEDEGSAKLFQENRNLVKQKMFRDPEYKAQMLEELGKLKGKAQADKLVAAGDQIKIAYLQKTEPETFNGPMAALGKFTNTVTFGQMARLEGSIEGKLIGGIPAEEYIKQDAEKLRLLQVAYPKASLVAGAAAYMIPGSPAKALFSKFAGIGSKSVGFLVDKMTSNPGIIPKVIQAAVAGGAGSAAVGAVEGTLGNGGAGEQSVSLDRGIQNSLATGKAGFLWSGALAGVGGALASQPVRNAAKSVGQGVDRLVYGLSGTPAAALRASNQNPQAIQAAAAEDAAYNAGKSFTEHLLATAQSAKEGNLPEMQQADQLLTQLPNVSARPTLNFLSGLRAQINPANKPAMAKFDEWYSHVLSKIPDTSGTGPGGLTAGKNIDQVPAQIMRGLVDDLQGAANDGFGKESNFLITGIKQASGIARRSIVDTAKTEGGAVGQSYSDLMDKVSERVGLMSYLKAQLGNNTKTMVGNSAAFMKRLFGSNPEFLQSKMARYDEIHGTNFLELAQNIKYASQLGPDGVPQALPTQRTGAALMGKAFGGAVGGTVGAAAGYLLGHGAAAVATTAGGAGGGAAVFGKIGETAGAIASSPKTGAMLIGASDKITGFVNAMAADPETLRQMGQSKQFGKVIQNIAIQVFHTLDKDGPISMGSAARVVADTPYFIGLVHAFDITQQQRQSQRTYDAAKRAEMNRGGR